jgi:CP family cyanate transporter-like MFS transporter
MTHGWQGPLALLLVRLVPLIGAGWGAARDAVVDPGEPEVAV